MRNFSSQVLISSSIALLLVGGAIVLVVTGDADNTQPEGVIDVDVEELLSRDTDGDGLFDWEEEMFATDPQLADTDGDGTNDKAEISAQRDPLRSGPNDQLSDQDYKNLITQDKNLTHSLFESLLPEGLMVANERLEGRKIDEEQLQNLATQPVELALDPGEKFKLSDAKVSPNLTPSEYAQSMIDLLSGYQDSMIGYEADIFKLLPQSETISSEEIDEISGDYKDLANAIIRADTLNGTAKMHSELANNYWNTGEVIAAFKGVENDSVSELLLANVYQELTFERDTILSNFENFYNQQSQ